MDFNAFKNEVKTIAFEQVRLDTDTYLEAVILNKHMAALSALLDKFLGVPIYPSPPDLPQQVQDAIKSYGGIGQGQMLYLKADGQDAIFAMLWPWQDKVRTTLKLVYKPLWRE